MKKHEKNSHSEKCEICDYCCKNSRNLKIHGKKVHEKNPQCKTCSSISDNDYELKVDTETCHEFQCEICDISFGSHFQLSEHNDTVHESKKKQLNCTKCEATFGKSYQLNQHIKTSHSINKKELKIGSLNIGKGLYTKEEYLKNTISEENFDIISVSEVDIEYFDEKKPYSIHGYRTFSTLKRPGANTKRLICFVKDNLEVTLRNDLMSELFSSVWLELKSRSQKILICSAYREFSDLINKEQMSVNQQLERWEIFCTQVQKASKEGLILCVGDFNIDLEKWEETTYYQKKLAQEYQSMIGKCGLELYNFGITWCRKMKNTLVQSALDHALTNKPQSVHSHFKTKIDYSDHFLICVNLKCEVPKFQTSIISSRDMRKLRKNPNLFLNELSKIEWESLANMNDINDMEEFWTSQINKCLNILAPVKTRKVKQKMFCLPKDVRAAIHRKKHLQKQHQSMVQIGKADLDLEREFKKQKNYCNKLIKKAVREKNCQNVTSDSTTKQIWNSVNDILKPEGISRNHLKIQTDDKLIDSPSELAEIFNDFFKNKVDNLASSIKKDVKIDPLSKLRQRLHGFNSKFKLKTVNEKSVLKIMKLLKSKKSCGHDGISSEILKLGANVLVTPLTYIINTSIKTGKYPERWKLAKIIPLHKKGDKKLLKNYRPIALLSVTGMVLEKIIALQIEEYFEKNKLFGSFQFGFRRNRNTISELLTVFDTLLEAKELKKEIIMLLYDLSAAFDTVSHEILLAKFALYGFDSNAMKWMKSFLDQRKQTVAVNEKISSEKEINIGTPQGSRLSPLLFVCLMADMDLWTRNSLLANFADDTQSIIINENLEEAIETTTEEANNVITFFGCNNLVNNADKAAVICNSRGQGTQITVNNIGGENLISTSSEKLLGLHLNSDFQWNIHIEKISIELKQRICILKRIKQRVPKEKLMIIAEGIFNSKVRYGAAVYLCPVFDEEELKARKLSENTRTLQTIQNDMLRTILGLKQSQCINMQRIREQIKMMSINQIAVYHTLLEAYNIWSKKSSSEQIKIKWTQENINNYLLRSKTKNDVKVPFKPLKKCQGFTYVGSKLFNKLPSDIRKIENPITFKSQTKTWIWNNIPSY